MKKFMVLTASLIIGTSCLAMDNQNYLPPEAVVAFTVDQTSVPADIWFSIISEDTEKYSNFKRLSFLRAVSKNWHCMITQHFSNLLRSSKLHADKIEKEIASINERLRNNQSGRRDAGELIDDKTSLTRPHLWGTWDPEAQYLFNEKMVLLRKLVQNEYIMAAMNKEILYRFIASKPSDRTEIENKGKELLDFIKSVRSLNTTISTNLSERGEEGKLSISMGASFARDIKKLEESTDVFGVKAEKRHPLAAKSVDWGGQFLDELQNSFTKAKKPRPFAARSVSPTGALFEELLDKFQ